MNSKPMTGTEANRFVLEVRAGVILYLNETIDADDGWWWGLDEDPLLEGPFASSADALADARRGGEFKVLHMDDKLSLTDENGLKLEHFSRDGHVVVIDTKGRLLVRTGERPATDVWSPVS
jgi:hypothetical protein